MLNKTRYDLRSFAWRRSQFQEGTFNKKPIYNPYLKIWWKIRKEVTDMTHDYHARNKLVPRYSWAVPDAEFAREILKYTSSVFEIGAGSGYWIWYLRQFGLRVTGVDKYPNYDTTSSNGYGNRAYWCPVFKIQEMEVPPADRALMFVWPSYDERWAANYLSRYRGNVVIYEGEGDGGCTGDGNFHRILDSDWDLVYTEYGSNWRGIHSAHHIYLRK